MANFERHEGGLQPAEVKRQTLANQPASARADLRNNRLKKRLFPYWLLLPTLILLLFLNVYPLIYSVKVSFTSFNTFGQAFGFAGLENYARILQDAHFWGSLGTTVLYTFVVVAAEMTLGLALALVLGNEKRFTGVLQWVLIIPMMISPLIVGVIWKLMYNTDMGIINYILNSAGLSSINWLGDPTLAFLSVVVVDIWQWTPMCFLIILAGLRSLPTDPFESAKIDGASAWQILQRITIPMLKPVLLVALLIRTMDALKTFDQIFVLTKGGPGRATETISFLMYQTAYKFSQFGLAAAGLFIVLI
ncbi:MAG TPA: sugar ABC transporter permease, partial [Bacillales bacterium]|nr:sugar ABC transporter permease [Bacillales bacterium]